MESPFTIKDFALNIFMIFISKILIQNKHIYDNDFILLCFLYILYWIGVVGCVLFIVLSIFEFILLILKSYD